MDQTLIGSIIDAHQHAFSLVANAWSDQGATSFYVTNSQGELLMRWPLIASVSGTTYMADINIGHQTVAKLHVAGTSNKFAQLRLLADAQLLGELLQMEYELQRMTADIIEQQDQLMALHQLAQMAKVQNDLPQMLRALTQIMAQLLKTEYAFIALLRPQQRPVCEMMPRNAWDEQLWTEILAVATDGLATGGLSRGGAANQQWLLQQSEEPLNAPPASLENLLVSRVVVQQESILLLGIANKCEGNFQAPDLKLFGTITAPSAAAIENVLLHQEMLVQARTQTEMELARQVQMRLLPQETPTIAGLQIAARTKPASQVGGDFFDFIDDHNGLLTFTVGDVSGKGMPAALMMAMLRTVLRGKVGALKEVAPDRLLAELNSALYRDFSDVDMFATIFVGQYDYQNHRLHYANDGHAPVIYRPVDGRAQLLEADAPPLGVVDFNLAQSYTLPFQVGDLLVVTTDGFNEAERSNGLLLGYDRLLQEVDALADAHVTKIANDLFSLVKTFVQGHPQSDDQTLLILKRI